MLDFLDDLDGDLKKALLVQLRNLSFIGAVGFVSGVISGKTIFSPFIAVFNPIVLTVVIGLAGTMTPATQVVSDPGSTRYRLHAFLWDAHRAVFQECSGR